MTREDSVTQSATRLSFSIENILREDFPPKSKLKFPPSPYHFSEKQDCLSNSNKLMWRKMPSIGYYFRPSLYYYGYLMHISSRLDPPLESKLASDGEKQQNLQVSMDYNTCKNCAGATLGQGDKYKELASNSCKTDREKIDEKIPDVKVSQKTEEKTKDTVNENTIGEIKADDRDAESKELYSRKRKTRSQFTKVQLKYLEDYYSNNSYLSRDERTVLAQALDMSELQIRNWFQNKRYNKKNRIQK